MGEGITTSLREVSSTEYVKVVHVKITACDIKALNKYSVSEMKQVFNSELYNLQKTNSICSKFNTAFL